MAKGHDQLELEPLALVIFGIAGDLSHRKLLPSLYYLTWHGLLPKHMRIVGITIEDMTVSELLKSVRSFIEQDGQKCEQKVLDELASRLELITLDATEPDDYQKLRERLDKLEDELGECMNRLFYLAIPAQLFGTVVRYLGGVGLNTGCTHGKGFSRLLVEKPFGYDLASAKELIGTIKQHFDEEQVYRIDHYLAKETAQNILNFRFQNPIFKREWDRESIKSIMVTVAEDIDIEGRANFYEQTGALRDVVQGHLMQLLALTTMEEPKTLTAGEIHRQKAALFKDITPISAHRAATETVRGQYKGYRSEVHSPDSRIETYAALRLHIDNERWRGVPVLLRTGKALAEKMAEITIVFADDDKLSQDNYLTIRIQPDEGISLQLLAKKPGFREEVEPVFMEFDYGRTFHAKGKHPDAYDYVLVDALIGDKTLFATDEAVLATWSVLDTVVREWAKSDAGLHQYAKGSWGPPAAEALAGKAGVAWPDENAKSKAAHK